MKGGEQVRYSVEDDHFGYEECDNRQEVINIVKNVLFYGGHHRIVIETMEEDE